MGLIKFIKKIQKRLQRKRRDKLTTEYIYHIFNTYKDSPDELSVKAKEISLMLQKDSTDLDNEIKVLINDSFSELFDTKDLTLKK